MCGINLFQLFFRGLPELWVGLESIRMPDPDESHISAFNLRRRRKASQSERLQCTTPGAEVPDRIHRIAAHAGAH